MALAIEMERKHLPNRTAQMSAAAVGFFLDREGHKKFLRTASNQELEVENLKLKQELTDKTDECSYWYTESSSYERSWGNAHTKIEGLERTLGRVRSELAQKKKSSEQSEMRSTHWRCAS